MVDARLLREQSQELAEKMAATEKAAHAAAGGPFNLGSPKQLQEVLYDRLDLPVLGKTPKGQPSTAEDVLEQLAESYDLPRLDPRIPRPHEAEIDVHRQAAARTSIRGPNASTRRITKPSRRRGGSRRPTRTCRTFRFARPKAGASARRSSRRRASSCWPPTTRRSSCGSWRICRATRACCGVRERAGHPSRDGRRGLRHAARAGDGRPAPFGEGHQLRPDLRDVRVRAGEAARARARRGAGLRRPLLPALPRRAALHGRDARRARGARLRQTVFGRRLYLPEINSRNAQRRQYAERSAINAPMQGTAADIIKRAMIGVAAWLAAQEPRARLIMQVHDELVVEVPEQSADEIGAPSRASWKQPPSSRAAARRSRARRELGRSTLGGAGTFTEWGGTNPSAPRKGAPAILPNAGSVDPGPPRRGRCPGCVP